MMFRDFHPYSKVFIFISLSLLLFAGKYKKVNLNNVNYRVRTDGRKSYRNEWPFENDPEQSPYQQ
jgi:hypothetical protein